MKMFKTLALGAAVSVGLLGASTATALTQGDLANESIGIFDITLEIGSVVQINSLENLPLTYVPGDSPDGGKANGIVEFCVYSNAASNGYKITATGAYNDGSNQAGFALGDNSGASISYQAWIKAQALNASSSDIAIPANGGPVSTTLTGSGTLNCGNTDNTSIFVETENNLETKDIGNYIGTLTLTVEPA
ncbi:hypothetical protein [Endozoicomonas ascidiicola]|uniref:hypothetical protein n=1 Tax=Endozoicomonas ascidiicola TaxID=1698521 RepID=UPI00082FBAF7|nr:hypothetical protein [Endozoicomonas ascidiicola]